MITRLSQSITESERMKLLRLRACRLEKGELCTVYSTSRSAYGDTLADVKSGYERGMRVDSQPGALHFKKSMQYTTMKIKSNSLLLFFFFINTIFIQGCDANPDNPAPTPVPTPTPGDGELLHHDKAVLVLREQMRDPFIQLAPDGYYYLSCTRGLDQLPDNLPAIQSWRSQNLVDWEDLGIIWEAKNGIYGQDLIELAGKRDIAPAVWAPEAHFVNGKWVIVHTSNMRLANLMLTRGSELTGPYEEPMALTFGFHRDASLFVDDDGTPWLLANCTEIRQLKKDFSGFEGVHKLLDPQDRYLGHEGACIIKFENKYILFGTAWSTYVMRKGTYNLYYCTADNVTGPYGPRKFAGRFLGHGTPFQDKRGRWWCTAFSNADNPPLDPDEAKDADLSGSAYTINKQGLTLVPLEIKMVNGDVEVIAKDENYRYPGQEEAQKF